jgi:sugar/nucleoside kinase (ribokinase family)
MTRAALALILCVGCSAQPPSNPDATLRAYRHAEEAGTLPMQMDIDSRHCRDYGTRYTVCIPYRSKS